MSNWGVAAPLALPAVYVPANDTSCTSSTATTVITTGALAALDNGDYYPLIWGVLTILLGGTAPSALTVKFILGSGSAVDTYTVEPALLVNSAELVIPIVLVGANSASAWAGSGSTINVQVTATGQAVTCKKVGSRLLVALFKGPDA
jgi:hypothetical protein